MKKNLVSTLVLLVVMLVVGGAGIAIGRHWNTVTPVSTTSTSTTTTVAATAQPASAIWPFASSATRFADPTSAAETFATDYLGFVRPTIGIFQRGDSRSGEIVVQSTAANAGTTILLRQLTPANTWWVIGAVSSHLVISMPSALSQVTSPMELRGQSTAFEAVVNVELRQDGSLRPLMKSTMLGGSMGAMGPFMGRFNFTPPQAIGGAVVLRTYSAKDGSVVDASALRVLFAH